MTRKPPRILLARALVALAAATAVAQPAAQPAEGTPPAGAAAQTTPPGPNTGPVPAPPTAQPGTEPRRDSAATPTDDSVKSPLPPTEATAPAPSGQELPHDQRPTDGTPGQPAAAAGDASHGSVTQTTGGPALPAWINEIDERPWDTGGNFWMPTPGATAADASDFMFYAVLGLSIFFFAGILIATVWFTIKYRARPGHKAQPSASHNDAMEITWTIIPTIIVVFLFIGGWNGYVEMKTRPAEPLTIKVTAKKWNWDFEYPNGLHTSDLHVPNGQPVELEMTSVDVLHSFFVPAFRVKQDIIPRRKTYIYFTPTRNGTYRLYCTEYCGREHSLMKVKAHVHDRSMFDRYISERQAAEQNLAPVDLGRLVWEKKGCAACHTIDGGAKVGPTWAAAWGKQVPLADGSSVPFDAAYVKTAIEEPTKQVHAGFAPTMPSYLGQLSEAEINGVAAFIESLK